VGAGSGAAAQSALAAGAVITLVSAAALQLVTVAA
jgi:hypothetical protein